MDAICPTVIGSLVGIWAALHKDLDVVIDATEARYLNGVVLGLDDELVARLLAAKLALSRVPDAAGDEAVACRGSEVAYAVQGRELRARLVHGTDASDGRLGVATRFGTALLGLRPGQALLWPTARGRLVEVQIRQVTVPHRIFSRHQSASQSTSAASCASG